MTGCALLSKADAVETRFYTIEPFAGDVKQAAKACGGMRIGRVDAGAALRERMMWRARDGEVGFYEDRRWTERPDVYVHRALSHALFEEAGLRQIVTGDAPVLDIDIVAFEEEIGPPRVARLRVTASLRDDRAVGWQETLTFEKPLVASAKGDVDADAIVRGLSDDLRDGARAIAARAAREMRRMDPAAASDCESREAASAANQP